MQWFELKKNFKKVSGFVWGNPARVMFFFLWRQGFETVLHTPIAQSYMGRVCGAVQPSEGGSADRAVEFPIVKVATARESPDLERFTERL